MDTTDFDTYGKAHKTSLALTAAPGNYSLIADIYQAGISNYFDLKWSDSTISGVNFAAYDTHYFISGTATNDIDLIAPSPVGNPSKIIESLQKEYARAVKDNTTFYIYLQNAYADKNRGLTIRDGQGGLSPDVYFKLQVKYSGSDVWQDYTSKANLRTDGSSSKRAIGPEVNEMTDVRCILHIPNGTIFPDGSESVGSYAFVPIMMIDGDPEQNYYYDIGIPAANMKNPGLMSIYDKDKLDSIDSNIQTQVDTNTSAISDINDEIGNIETILTVIDVGGGIV
jgi:hypothetical protein